MKNLYQNLFSLLTSLVVVINLAFWLCFLIVLSVLKFSLRNKNSQQWLDARAETCYRLAAALDTFWMSRVVRIELDVQGTIPDHPAPVIICNHQSWMDIPVLQAVFTSRGPILKFLIKRELRWVPVVGWICYLLNFPALRRGQGKLSRERDHQEIRSFSSRIINDRGALVIFPEGTRFSSMKLSASGADFSHLLKPRSGGLKTALASLPEDTPIIDTTIYYSETSDFWSCLGGGCKRISIKVDALSRPALTNLDEWLTVLWQQKDRSLAASLQNTDSN